MSSDVEEQVKEEEVKEVKVGKRPLMKIGQSFRGRLELGVLVFKIIQLVLCVICVSLFYEPLSSTLPGKDISICHVGVMYTAFGGYMVINGVILLSKLMGDAISYRISSLFALVGAALFLATGILVTVDRSDYHSFPPLGHNFKYLMIGIVFIFVNFILFAVDTVISFVMYVSQSN